MNTQDIRWKQRFSNFKKAYEHLNSGIKIANERDLSNLEEQGLIQAFEFTFELAWKTLKDYLEYQKVEVKFPRGVIKSAFKYDLIDDGEIWLSMLDKRNLMAHTYDEKTAQIAYNLIVSEFSIQLSLFFQNIEEKNE
jgi:nucleotidyltransferase substrate binding protein (TIGR01987 family)